jgi:hypothetical protein
VSVPFWASHSSKSMLLAELQTVRPDLFDLGGPLQGYRSVEPAPGIPRTISNPNINKHYLRLWAKDRRFQDLFFKNQKQNDVEA